VGLGTIFGGRVPTAGAAASWRIVGLSVQKVLSGSGRAGRLRLMGIYICHRLVARSEPDNTFWTDKYTAGAEKARQSSYCWVSQGKRCATPTEVKNTRFYNSKRTDSKNPEDKYLQCEGKQG